MWPIHFCRDDGPRCSTAELTECIVPARSKRGKYAYGLKTTQPPMAGTIVGAARCGGHKFLPSGRAFPDIITTLKVWQRFIRGHDSTQFASTRSYIS